MKASKNPGVGRVDVFEAETTQLVRRYNDLGVPAAIAFDAAGDVYVADSRRNDVYIYQVRTLLRRLTDETDEPVALAFDENENVYVSNTNGNAVTVYQAGKKTLIRSITGGIDKPKPLAFGP
jgi:DNA-binding beta-propeller fold protein YncE